MNHHHRPKAMIIGAALGTLLTLHLAQAAPPTRVTVTAANPDSALQGETLDVVISGSGFGPGASVRYLVSGTNEDSQILVNSVVYNEGNGTLTTSIDVQQAALVADYDIEVRAASGRKGKGTTLFKVLQSNGGGGVNSLPTITCDELFGFPIGTCTAAGTLDPCMLEQPIDNERDWGLIQDCDTRAMLVVNPDYPFLRGGGFRLNVVSPWSGDSAVIATSRGSSMITGFHIVVDELRVAGVAAGCLGTLRTAVRFDPDLQPSSSAPRGAVSGNVVETRNGAQLCNGIEFVGSNPTIKHPYKGQGVISNTIMANSYERSGIEVANINLSDEDTKRGEEMIISENFVEATDSPCAIGLLLGPNIERLPVHDNWVVTSDGSGCAFNTAGIVIADSGRNKTSPMGSSYDFLEARTVELYRNTVYTGGNGSIGIVIDSATSADMWASEIHAGQGTDIGVCVETGAEFGEIRRSSDYLGFDAGNEVVPMVDCGVDIP